MTSRVLVLVAGVLLAGCNTQPRESQPAPVQSVSLSAAQSPPVAEPVIDTSIQTTRVVAFFYDGKLDRCIDHLYTRVGPTPKDRNEEQALLESVADENTKVEKNELLLHKSCEKAFPQRAVFASCVMGTASRPTSLGVVAKRKSTFNYYFSPVNDEIMKKCLEMNGTWQEGAQTSAP